MKKFIAEFKEFAIKGNMIDLAVGLVVGTAFTTVVKSIVDDLIMPIIGFLTGGKDFSAFIWKIGEAEVKYGLFIQNIVNFLIISFCLFLVVKVMNKLKKKEEVKEEIIEEVKKSDEAVLLEEIRDLLKKEG